jgi:hypothetical protein
MIELILAAALQAPETPAPVGEAVREERLVTRRPLNIPNEVANEITPYMNCLVEQSNAQFRAPEGFTEERFTKMKSEVLGACSGARVAAKDAAIKGLGGTHVSRKERPEYVEGVIVGIEDVILSSPWATPQEEGSHR